MFIICCLFLFVIPVIFSACNEPNTVGLEVQPEGDQATLGFTDTFTVITNVVKEDSVPSDEAYTNLSSKTLVGYMYEPEFGSTTANLYAQLIPTETPTMPVNMVIDSAIFTLAYKDFYGDTTSEQTVEIFEMNEPILDSVYYSNKSFSTYPTVQGTLSNFKPKTKDSITINGTKYAPHLRIPVSKNFAKEVFDSAATYTTLSDYINHIKGVYLSFSGNAPGGIITIDPNSSLTGMTIYYRDTAAAPHDTLEAKFNLKEAFRVSNFNHNNYSGSVVSSYFGNPTLSASQCYIQSMGGVRTKINFPFLSSIDDAGPVAISKAELVVTVVDGTSSTYAANERLGIAGISSEGKPVTIPDHNETSAYLGGSLSGNKYRFNIARYVQSVLNGNWNDYGLYLLASAPYDNPHRVIVGGGQNSNPSYRMKLQITYTKLNP